MRRWAGLSFLVLVVALALTRVVWLGGREPGETTAYAGGFGGRLQRSLARFTGDALGDYRHVRPEDALFVRGQIVSSGAVPEDECAELVLWRADAWTMANAVAVERVPFTGQERFAFRRPSGPEQFLWVELEGRYLRGMTYGFTTGSRRDPGERDERLHVHVGGRVLLRPVLPWNATDAERGALEGLRVGVPSGYSAHPVWIPVYQGPERFGGMVEGGLVELLGVPDDIYGWELDLRWSGEDAPFVARMPFWCEVEPGGTSQMDLHLVRPRKLPVVVSDGVGGNVQDVRITLEVEAGGFIHATEVRSEVLDGWEPVLAFAPGKVLRLCISWESWKDLGTGRRCYDCIDGGQVEAALVLGGAVHVAAGPNGYVPRRWLPDE